MVGKQTRIATNNIITNNNNNDNKDQPPPSPTDRCTSSAEFEAEEGTHGLRYARVSPFEDDDEAVTGSDAEGSVNGVRRRTVDEVLGPELRDLADRTAVVVSE